MRVDKYNGSVRDWARHLYRQGVRSTRRGFGPTHWDFDSVETRPGDISWERMKEVWNTFTDQERVILHVNMRYDRS